MVFFAHNDKSFYHKTYVFYIQILTIKPQYEPLGLYIIHAYHA